MSKSSSISTPYDCVIIGAGPAGLTAALYLARANKHIAVLESLTPGGQIINSIDVANYPAAPHISGATFASELTSQVEELGVEIVEAPVTKIEPVATMTERDEEEIRIFSDGVRTAAAGGAGSSAHGRPPLGTRKARRAYGPDEPVVEENSNFFPTKTVIIATGASHRHLNLPHESDLTGRGISYCATCDGGFFRNQPVAINGGGDTALDDALYLSDLASDVYLIHRRQEFRGQASTVKKLRKKSNVHFILDTTITALHPDPNSHKLKSITLTHKDETTDTLDINALFIAIGQTPNTDPVKNILKLDPSGYIPSDESCTTELPWLFAAGDVRTKSLRQLVTATADGAIAATAVIDYLNSRS